MGDVNANTPMPVRLNGQVFESARIAADHFNCTPEAIWKAIEDGREDRFQVARLPSAVPVKIGPFQFSSFAAVGREFGFTGQRVKRALQAQSGPAYEELVGRAMRKLARLEGRRVREGRDGCL